MRSRDTETGSKPRIATLAIRLLVEQIGETIVRFVRQAPNLAQIMSTMCFLRKVRYPAKIQDGRQFSRWLLRQMQKMAFLGRTSMKRNVLMIQTSK